MAWLAGIGIKETFGYLCRCDLKEFKKPPFKLAWVLVVWSAIVSMIMVRGPEKFRRGLESISAAENAAENPIVLQMTQYRDGTRRVFIDRVIYAFHAKIPVPPELAVIPSKRIWSGQITPTEIIEKLEQYKPEQIVLFGSLRNQGN